MFYTHKDFYPNDKWHLSFENVLEEKNYSYKLINILSFENFGEVSSNDSLLARFGQKREEKKKLSTKINKVYKTWNRVFPPRKAYELYDDKWREYIFLKKHSIPVLNSKFVSSKSELFNFLVSNSLDFPIVVKKKEGAGADFVEKITNPSHLDSNFFPCIVQDYKNVDFDLRIIFLNEKLFCIKRHHKKSGDFPYGGKWYETSTDFSDPLNHLSKEFILNVWRVFGEEIGSPTMSFDILITNNGPKVLEFSYCFSKKQVFQTDHYYSLPEFNKTVFYKNREYKNPEYIKNAVAIEVLNWIEARG